MAKGGTPGDWLIIEELFERGDPAFVDALRQFDDADRLGAFAPAGSPTCGPRRGGSCSTTSTGR